MLIIDTEGFSKYQTSNNPCSNDYFPYAQNGANSAIHAVHTDCYLLFLYIVSLQHVGDHWSFVALNIVCPFVIPSSPENHCSLGKLLASFFFYIFLASIFSATLEIPENFQFFLIRIINALFFPFSLTLRR